METPTLPEAFAALARLQSAMEKRDALLIKQQGQIDGLMEGVFQQREHGNGVRVIKAHALEIPGFPTCLKDIGYRKAAAPTKRAKP